MNHLVRSLVRGEDEIKFIDKQLEFYASTHDVAAVSELSQSRAQVVQSLESVHEEMRNLIYTVCSHASAADVEWVWNEYVAFFNPDESLYDLKLRTFLSRFARLGPAWRIFSEMREKNMIPSFLALSDLLSLVSCLGDMEKCDMLFRLILEVGHSPDNLQSYKKILMNFFNVCYGHRDLEKTLLLLQLMKKSDLPFPLHCFDNVVFNKEPTHAELTFAAEVVMKAFEWQYLRKLVPVFGILGGLAKCKDSDTSRMLMRNVIEPNVELLLEIPSWMIPFFSISYGSMGESEQCVNCFKIYLAKRDLELQNKDLFLAAEKFAQKLVYSAQRRLMGVEKMAYRVLEAASQFDIREVVIPVFDLIVHAQDQGSREIRCKLYSFTWMLGVLAVSQDIQRIRKLLQIAEFGKNVASVKMYADVLSCTLLDIKSKVQAMRFFVEDMSYEFPMTPLLNLFGTCFPAQSEETYQYAFEIFKVLVHGREFSELHENAACNLLAPMLLRFSDNELATHEVLKELQNAGFKLTPRNFIYIASQITESSKLQNCFQKWAVENDFHCRFDLPALFFATLRNKNVDACAHHLSNCIVHATEPEKSLEYFEVVSKSFMDHHANLVMSKVMESVDRSGRTFPSEVSAKLFQFFRSKGAFDAAFIIMKQMKSGGWKINMPAFVNMFLAFSTSDDVEKLKYLYENRFELLGKRLIPTSIHLELAGVLIMNQELQEAEEVLESFISGESFHTKFVTAAPNEIIGMIDMVSSLNRMDLCFEVGVKVASDPVLSLNQDVLNRIIEAYESKEEKRTLHILMTLMPNISREKERKQEVPLSLLT